MTFPHESKESFSSLLVSNADSAAVREKKKGSVFRQRHQTFKRGNAIKKK